ISIYEGNACDLSFLDDNSFDIVLLLGPMYHLFDENEKHKAISEAIRLSKTGGVVFVSYCNNDTCIYKFFGRRTMIKQMKKGFVTSDFRARPKNVFELYRKPDIDNLMKNYNVERLHFVGVDMLSYVFDDRFDKLNDREFKLYIEFLESICEREDLVGFSIHMLDIFRKGNEYDYE
ncbi:MAG: class I SAM-dependent methyltransferase, partial [Eubacterium sp.]|nr:class I SAM-dependent methyltransferase [Eubacterium sp.]